MGGNLNLDFLTERECEHIKQVIEQDFIIRATEKQRISEIEASVKDEETKARILSKRCAFNDKTCIRCLSRFIIFFNSRYLCDECKYFVCRRCLRYNEKTQRHVCEQCLKQIELKHQKNEWYYEEFSKKFTRCGSTEVVQSLYDSHDRGYKYRSQVDLRSDRECNARGNCHQDGLLHLVQSICKTQGQVSTTANRMIQSANDINALYEELDRMDAALNNLELDVTDIACNGVDEGDGHPETSAEAVGDVTSVALDFLGSVSHALSGYEIAEEASENVEAAVGTKDDISSELSVDDHMQEYQDTVDPLKSLEQQIYLVAGDVFSLEEHIQKLTEDVLASDENTCDDVMSALDNQVALAVAKVAHAETEVVNIEQSLFSLPQRKK